MLKVLITDDQQHVLDALELLFVMRGELEVTLAKSPREAVAAIEAGGIGVVVHDMNFSEGTTRGDEGVALFHQIRQLDPEMPVILMTAWASLESAVELVRLGADDYLRKPWDDALLLKKVKNLLRAREHQLAANGAARRQSTHRSAAQPDLCGLLFRSAIMHSVVSLAVKVAASAVSVLITGPNGSGKEKVAEIIQANSPRKNAPFVKVNVGALPDELFAAELFGAEAGAFTGARTRRMGRFEAAHGGTLFLDEMGNLSLESQAKLLRALQSGEFERLGSNQTHVADVRIIAATNSDMSKAIAEGRFREDLYYRLAVIELEVPPLADRPEDIVLLAQAFAEQFQAESSGIGATMAEPKTGVCFGARFERALADHDWPGNVRELQNRMKRALLVADGEKLGPEHLGLGGHRNPTEQTDNAPAPAQVRAPRHSESMVGGSASANANTGPASLDQAERETIERALAEAEYVISRAASSLGLSRQALYRRMQRLGLRLKRDVESE